MLTKVEPAIPDDLPQLRALLALLFGSGAEFEAAPRKHEDALRAARRTRAQANPGDTRGRSDRRGRENRVSRAA